MRYRINLDDDLPHLTTIDNCAAIHFDVNPPVITNTVVNTLIDCGLHTSSITYLGIDVLQASEGESYQWYLDGLPIGGATGQELLVLSEGSYAVEVTNEYGCVSLSDDFLVIGMEVGASPALNMALIPNPARDHMRLIASEPITAEQRITLTDVHGRAMRQFVGTGSREVIIDLGDLALGLYVVRVAGTAGLVAACRVVVE